MILRSKPLLLGALVLIGTGFFLVFRTPALAPFRAPDSVVPQVAPEIPWERDEQVLEEKPKVLPTPITYDYLEVIDSCGAAHEGACVVARSGAGTTSPVVAKLRTGVVLRVRETVSVDGHDWYKVAFDDWVRYPERVTGDWYVSAKVVRPFRAVGNQEFIPGVSPATAKRIVVDRSSQMLYAYDGDTLFMEQSISTGLALSPTPRGKFTVYKKTPSRYMQGPLPGISDQYYDLPGVPWNLYFTLEGGVIHGAYWHNNFGKQWSHGCVNLPPSEAQKLYEWADVGTSVLVRD